MSQTDTFYLPNLAGAPFRALLNQILAALSAQNSGSQEPKDPFAGMVWLDTSKKPPVFQMRNADNSGWVKIFTAETPPTKGQVGLGNVPNYGATSDLADGSENKLLLAKAGNTLQESKLAKNAQASDSAKLGGKPASTYAEKAGTYSNLRAQATTKADVGLGSVQNYGITDSINSNNSKQYLSAKGGYDLNQAKVNKTTTINGKPLSDNITLSAANVGAIPSSGGNLGGAINFTPDTGDIITLDGKSALRRITQAGGLSLGCAHTLILGCGESWKTLADNVSATAEETHIGSDTSAYIYTNLQTGWDARKGFEFQMDGGFLPANTAKTRKNLSVYSTSETYSKSEVYKKSETYSRAEVDAEIPKSGYALLDFGTITTDERHVKDNPFGNNTPVQVIAECQYQGVWSAIPVVRIGHSGSSGVNALYVENEGIVVQTARQSLATNSNYQCNAFEDLDGYLHELPCRVHVWRLTPPSS